MANKTFADFDGSFGIQELGPGVVSDHKPKANMPSVINVRVYKELATGYIYKVDKINKRYIVETENSRPGEDLNWLLLGGNEE